MLRAIGLSALLCFMGCGEVQDVGATEDKTVTEVPAKEVEEEYDPTYDTEIMEQLDAMDDEDDGAYVEPELEDWAGVTFKPFIDLGDGDWLVHSEVIYWDHLETLVWKAPAGDRKIKVGFDFLPESYDAETLPGYREEVEYTVVDGKFVSKATQGWYLNQLDGETLYFPVTEDPVIIEMNTTEIDFKALSIYKATARIVEGEAFAPEFTKSWVK